LRKSTRLMEVVASASVTRDQETLIALASAARGGQVPVVERHLETQLRPNALSVALVAAARGGHLIVVERLLQQLSQWGIGVHHYEQDYMTGLRVAAKYGHKAVVERLLQKSTLDNVGVARKSALEAAAAAGQSTVVEQLLQKGGEMSPRHVRGAVVRSQFRFFGVEEISEKRGKINSQDVTGAEPRSPLVSAAAQGHMDIVEQFIRHHGYVSTIDFRGSALDLASLNGHEEVVARLSVARDDVNYSIHNVQW